ncbi:MAG: UDP-glucose/GDP-mannose dehydrogenase family protein [Gemmatimonadetes bacterium]|nr:UDP-glucose/GDP-mannose dehydrogenase family protein [Gemmatimonadota bacterium]
MKISVVGLGKLGAPLAALLADKGHTVIGVDVDARPVLLMNQGRTPVFEPGLPELIERAGGRLSATTDFAEAIAGTDITFIVVPTPSNRDGGFSLEYVLAVCEAIGAPLGAKGTYHLVVLTSTVMPGATEGEVLPALETFSGKRCGTDFGLCYGPEFIALGTVIRDMLNPDLVLIGESHRGAGDLLEALWKGVCENGAPAARMNFVNAELTKLAVNTYVTTKISYANMLAQVCERVPGANVDVVTSTLGLDSRIGQKYLKGALGYGGPCFPRDNLAFASLARRLGVRAVLAEATDQVNRQQVPRIAETILARLPKGGTVGILGLAYKPNTDVVEEAQGLQLARHLLSVAVPVVLYDPAALEGARARLDGDVTFASSMEECAGQAHVVVVATPWEEFSRLKPNMLNYSDGRPTVVDCWRMLAHDEYTPFAEYIAIGVH